MRAALAGLVAFAVASGSSIALLSSSAEEVAPASIAFAADDDTPLPRITERDAAMGVDAPTWEAGYAWTFARDDRPPCVVAVYAAEETYRQGFACEYAQEEAFREAARPSGLFGNLTRSLSTQVDGAERAFYQWPLVDGASWETSDGLNDYEVHASYAVVDGPFGEEPGFLIEAEFAGGSDPVILWNYVPSIGWWSHYESRVTGTVVDVVNFTRAYHGDVLEGTARIASEYATTTGVPPAAILFSAGEADEDVLFVGVAQGLSSFQVTLRTPDQRATYQQNHLAPFLAASPDTWDYYITAMPGQWRVEVTGVIYTGLFQWSVFLGSTTSHALP